MDKKKDLTLVDILKDDNTIYMGARVDKKGGADAFVHAEDDEKGGVVESLFILFALLLKTLERKTGYSAELICKVSQKYLDDNHPGHDKGTKGVYKH